MMTWVLTFIVAMGPSFVGGEYLDEWRCELAALHQLRHWRAVYHPRKVAWRCDLLPPDAPRSPQAPVF